MKLLKKLIAPLAAVGLLAACSTTDSGTSSSESAKSSGDDKLAVYATTGYLADAVANIAPEAKITTMVGPGGDPHTYKPSTKDVEAMNQADLVLWNGLHLEAQMIDQLESFGNKQLAVGSKVDENLLLDWPETDAQGNPLKDPHIWNSPKAWTQVVDAIGAKLGELDPDNAKTYEANADKYEEKIKAMDAKISEGMKTVKEPRILVTGHDAFNYFGKTYGLDVRATDFVSTEAKLSATELAELAAYIADNKVPVIFLDNQANPQAIKSLQEAVKAKGWDVKVSDEELYADSLGSEAPVDTYLGAYQHNADAVVSALGEK